MKPEFDREIDALLRSRAGGGKSPARTGGASAPDGRSRGGAAGSDRAPVSHLDADELAAFAEGALPAPARARYVAHLADCGDCRRAATQLALAVGVARVREERETAAAVATENGSAARQAVTLSWRERVAAFFAPSAWRYAMPVVALLCVGVIALVVMRRAPNAASQLASNKDASRTAAPSAGSAPSADYDEHHAQAPNDQLAEVSTDTQGSAPDASIVNEKAEPRTAGRGEGAGNNQAPSQTASNAVSGNTAGVPANSPAGASSGGAAEVRRADDLPAPAPPPAAAQSVATKQAPETQPLPALVPQATPTPQATPAPPATTAPANEEERVEIAKDKKARQSELAAEREQPKARRARAQNRDAQGGAASPSFRVVPDANAAASAAGNANAGPKETTQRAARAEKKKDEDKAADSARAKSLAGETRKVAGRHFRREGDAWIDTAYRGEATTVVRRGSEQFRALVADEPEIARVASTLGGEVVVVWKGRAYRIR